MSVFNANRWNELCDLQIATMNNLARAFPERQQHIQHVSSGWKDIQQQLKQQKVPTITSR